MVEVPILGRALLAALASITSFHRKARNDLVARLSSMASDIDAFQKASVKGDRAEMIRIQSEFFVKTQFIWNRFLQVLEPKADAKLGVDLSNAEAIEELLVLVEMGSLKYIEVNASHTVVDDELNRIRGHLRGLVMALEPAKGITAKVKKPKISD
jgi:hypothetical protein